LSGGEQQMLSIGRTLMALPKFLMPDEPSLGIAPLVVKDIYGIFGQINSEGITILLAEQNVYYALNISTRAYVLVTVHIALE
jgi:branched-chain amino acid transport system ATP-binding protein